jgi:hypothetical protein
MSIGETPRTWRQGLHADSPGDFQPFLPLRGLRVSNFAARTEDEDRAWHSTHRVHPATILFLKA